ncbi:MULTISPECIES: KGK domain-containing protein [Nostocales]|uniref:KGK family protein n=2 Tax=Nostocales TaxID=1161 RepID=A0A0C1REN4_9CYAN|nr:KGK domain-containing protein [Tolypothrix bouteillei]KAF3886675.1 KGK family protein [Tolypothrix bouteillei VB521301]
MNNKFTPLVCDDDVILFEKDTFKISRLKELLSTDMSLKLNQIIYNQQTQKPQGLVIGSFAKASIVQEHIELSEIQFHSIKNCQILRICGKGWQKGKLKIQVSQSIINQKLNQVYLEFCPDEPDDPESPLDDIRKLI